MKLNKATRKRLYEAKKPIWISWPLAEVRSGRTYRVSLKGGKSFGILVLKTKERGTKALIKIHDDPTPILPGLRGVRNEAGDYESEPQPVDAEYQAKLSLQANQAAAVLAANQQRRSKVHRLELKRAEAIKLNKPGRVKVLTTRIERYRLDAA